MWQCPVKGYSLLDQMTCRNLNTSSVNLMLGPVNHTPLLDQMSIQFQFMLRNTVVASVHEFYVLKKKKHYVNTKTLFTTPCVYYKCSVD
jgi:hypothetical protein